MAVRYAENLTLFKSAAGWGEKRIKIREEKSPYRAILAGLVSSCKSDWCNCPWRWLRGANAKVDYVTRLARCVSEGGGTICRAAGLQQTLPKFHWLLWFRLLIKEQSHSPSHGDRRAHGYWQGWSRDISPGHICPQMEKKKSSLCWVLK